MKKIVLFAGLLGMALMSIASTDSTRFLSSRWGVQFSGYVNPHLWVDTRQIVGGRDGQLILWPAKPSYDENGEDINANANLNMLGITSRFGLQFSTPDVLNAKVHGQLEADFSGSIDMANNSFRLRHAFIQMDWEKSSVLFGQTWHPLVVPEIMPSVAPLNTGAPFHPYTRQMQIRYAYQANEFKIFAAALTQRDNTSDGPIGASATYMRNAVIPNLHLQMQYKKGNLFAGIAGDMKVLKPRLSFSVGDSTFKTDTKIYSYTGTVFAKYDFSQWDIKFQALWAQNQSDNLMLGGYAETFIAERNEYEYTNSSTFSTWINISRTKGKWRPGIFLGYAKNLGFSDEIKAGSTIYGRGIVPDLENESVDYLWRVQPRLVYKASERLEIYTDVEYTAAAFGKADSKGVIKSSSSVGNTRFMLGMVFLF